MKQQTELKILFIATVCSHLGLFHADHARTLRQKGHTVEAASNNDSDNRPGIDYSCFSKMYQINSSRNPLSKDNFDAYKKIKKLLNDKNYDIVHCSTPIASVLTRLAARKHRRKKNMKVIYTAHGFQFYKGGPKKDWLLYFPLEWLCSFFTDTLITINEEDYQLAKKHFHAKKVVKIPGVGIDVKKFQNAKSIRNKICKKLHIPNDSFIVLSVGELNKNKNHIAALKALTLIDDKKIHYIILGAGPQKENLIEFAKANHMHKNLHLVGYKNNVAEYYKSCNLFVFPSLREGLPVSLMEALASGLPAIATNIRGCKDIKSCSSGCYLYNKQEIVNLKKLIEYILCKKNIKANLKHNQYDIKFLTKKFIHVFEDLN